MSENDDAESYEKNIKVFVRILPLEKSCESCAKIDGARKKIYVRCLQELQPNRIAAPRKPSYWCFRTDGIFYDASQEQVYQESVGDLVQKVLGGVSGVLVGYGQEGSGKSFTISGLRNNWEQRGVVTRLLSDMFAEKANRRKASKIEYHLSFVELHGKDVTDLLVTDAESRIKINDRNAFKDISAVNVKTEEETLKKIFEGESRRSIVKGSTYPASHLATSVITFHVTNSSLITSCGVTATAKMHIVEMAGTGTVGKSSCWKTAADIGIANLAKTQLEQFFSYLGSTKSSDNHSLLRSSNLLKILGNAFSVTSVIRFIFHVRITREDLDITLSTLRFCAKIARLKPVKTMKNVNPVPLSVIQKLRDEVNSLRKELFFKDLLANQETLRNISKSRAEQINRSVLSFLNGTVSDLTLFSVSQTQVLLKSMKDLYNKLTAKELDVDKLRETYENMTRNGMQTIGSARSSKETGITINAFLTNRKKRKTSSQRTLYENEECTEQVGSLDKFTTGVTLGPHVADISAPDRVKINKYARASEKIFQLDTESPSVLSKIRQLFERFSKDDRDHCKLNEKLQQNEKILAKVRQRFSSVIEEYYKAKRNLDNARGELTKQRQIRRFTEMEENGDKESTIIPESERRIARDIACYERTLANLEEEVKQTQGEIHDLIYRRLAIRSKLEFAFREYCGRLNLPFYNDGMMKIVFDSMNTEASKTIRRKFDHLQRSIIRKIEDKQKSKIMRLD